MSCLIGVLFLMSCLIGVLFSSVATSILAEVSFGISQMKLKVSAPALSGMSCHGETTSLDSFLKKMRKSVESASPVNSDLKEENRRQEAPTLLLCLLFSVDLVCRQAWLTQRASSGLPPFADANATPLGRDLTVV